MGSGTRSRRRPNLRRRCSSSPEMGEVGRPGLVWLGFWSRGEREMRRTHSWHLGGTQGHWQDAQLCRAALAAATRRRGRNRPLDWGFRLGPTWGMRASHWMLLCVRVGAQFGATVVGLGAPRRRGLCAPVRRGMDSRGTGRKGITAEKSHYLPV